MPALFGCGALLPYCIGHVSADDISLIEKVEHRKIIKEDRLEERIPGKELRKVGDER
jgi:hypothetical protein